MPTPFDELQQAMRILYERKMANYSIVRQIVNKYREFYKKTGFAPKECKLPLSLYDPLKREAEAFLIYRPHTRSEMKNRRPSVYIHGMRVSFRDGLNHILVN